MKKTDNYSLPQWEKQDFIKMEDFNDAFGKTDAALKANADATATGLNAEIAARGEADAAEAENRSAALAALQASLAAAIGSGGKTCRIFTGSYTGTGATGAASPNTLQFDFYPVLVLVAPVKPSGSTQNPSIFLRGRDKASSQPEGGNDYQLTAAWTDNALSWYSTDTYAGYQHNFKGNVYCYAVLGYDKVKEEA